MTPREHIELCIRRCAKAKDGRGAARAEGLLRAALAVAAPVTADSAERAARTAAAARSAGEFIRDWRPT